ncbi:MAG: hypothetical protein Q7T08_02855 [Devosia sp.]|nr:hypothetical protein [Devosia sp.]
MSYDLYITPRQFDVRAMCDWFERRNHYEVSDVQALYSNADTGTYFSFDFEPDPSAEEGEERRQPYVAFNLNFFRPHTFGLEAEPEIAAFLAQFDSAIHDPQTDGMADGPYSREGFLRGWNAGNRFGFSAVGRRSNPPPPWAIDPVVIEAVWKWNYGRADLQNAVGDQIFAPRVFWFLLAGADAPIAACVWTSDVPTLIPESAATHIALLRKPRRSLLSRVGFTPSGDESQVEMKFVRIRDVADVVVMDRRDVGGYQVLSAPIAQTNGVRRLFSGPWPSDATRTVPTEDICGTDLVALMKQSS